MESLKNRIHNLSDENLLEMLRNRGDYLAEATEIALAECAERGLAVPEWVEAPVGDVPIRRGYFDLFFSGFLEAYRDFLRRHFAFLFFLSLGLVLITMAGVYFMEAFNLMEHFSEPDALSDNLYLLALVNSFYATIAILLYYWKANRVTGAIHISSFFSTRMESRVTAFAFSLFATAAFIFLFSNLKSFLEGDNIFALQRETYGNPLQGPSYADMMNYSAGSNLIHYLFTHLFTVAISLIPAVAVTSGLRREFGISWVWKQRLPWVKIIVATLLGTILVKAIAMLLSAQIQQIQSIIFQFNDMQFFIQLVAVTFMQLLLFPAYVALLYMPFHAAGVYPDPEEESAEDENEELFEYSPTAGAGGPAELD
jgi:hypothetical protein